MLLPTGGYIPKNFLVIFAEVAIRAYQKCSKSYWEFSYIYGRIKPSVYLLLYISSSRFSHSYWSSFSFIGYWRLLDTTYWAN
jgi:hypothetical protein